LEDKHNKTRNGDDKKMLQIGDRVKIISDDCGSKGQIGTIDNINQNGASTNLCLTYHPFACFQKIEETTQEQTDLRIGDEVEIIDNCDQKGKKAKITAIRNSELGIWITTNLCLNEHRINYFKKINNMEENKMELKELKKENIKEAEKQFKEDKKNAEIEFAKTELRSATDNINELDRQIKALEERKKPYLDKIKMFS
jgi:hypothetical protein